MIYFALTDRGFHAENAACELAYTRVVPFDGPLNAVFLFAVARRPFLWGSRYGFAVRMLTLFGY